MPNTEQFLYQTEKQYLHTAASEMTLQSDYLELGFWIEFKTISIQ